MDMIMMNMMIMMMTTTMMMMKIMMTITKTLIIKIHQTPRLNQKIKFQPQMLQLYSVKFPEYIQQKLFINISKG